jgi:hypothetical protein
MDCEICITFERSLRDLEAELASSIKGCEAATSQNEKFASRGDVEAAVGEFLTQRSLYDHHRHRAHAESLLPRKDSQKI